MAIEIRERYRDVVRDRWPVSVDPQPDELLSSWLHRLAIANGIATRPFASALGSSDRMWSPRLDLRLPREAAALLADPTNVPQETISAMTDPALTPLLLPLRENVHRNRSSWMQYCPLCLASDEAPYFRRRWRLASRISCFAHGCGLRDRCPACRTAIVSFDQVELVPQHFCARCGFDLRAAPKARVNAAARRLERAIMDICRVESPRGSAKISDVVSRVLRAPAVADIGLGGTLTNLSTAARIRCFEQLAVKPLDWLVTHEDAAVAHRRRMILAAGGHDELIARFADFLGKHQTRPRSMCPQQPRAGLADVLTAYLRVASDRTTSKCHRRLRVPQS
ncbi:TniQ family protein [Mesorhizobium sp. L-2-11]|uniref:TniQ family protein n=1 Tax=Mesorhizobium sp. L-2-11 TaxID=2744521 RepID=UPI001FD41CE2|nr:TniQ family protein [Mesorhizobium sp. L-2-11]